MVVSEKKINIFDTMRLNLSLHLPLFFVLIFPLLANGQIRQPLFDILTVESGSPENSPAVTLEDNLEYIWIGPQNSLLRYDEYDLKLYNLDIESGKFDRNYTPVFSLLNGMVRYDPAKDRLTRVGYIQNSKGKFVNEDGVLCAKTGKALPYDIASNTLIFKLNQSRSKLQYIRETNKLNVCQGGSAVSMALLPNGSFPVCTTRGLYKSNKTLSTYKPFPFKNIKSEAILANHIKVKRQGQVWISSQERLIQQNTLTNKSKAYAI